MCDCKCNQPKPRRWFDNWLDRIRGASFTQADADEIIAVVQSRARLGLG